MDITKDLNYQEGFFAAERVIPNIENTIYQTIEAAILIKEDMIKQFESQFGYSKEMVEFDRNYSYNYGMLDRFKKEVVNG